MAIEFNYYDFKEKNQLKYEVDIDLSGLKVKSSPTASIIDEDTGKATEINLDEIKDDKVNFVYTGEYKDLINPINSTTRQQSGKEPLREFIFSNNVDDTPTLSLNNIPRYTVGESVIDTSLIDYGETSDNAKIISKGASSGIENPTFYDVDIMPRHLMMRNDDTNTGIHYNRTSVYTETLVNTSDGEYNINMAEVLSALNLWNSDPRSWENNSDGYIDKKTFNSRINVLRNEVQTKNIDIEITEYPENLTEGGYDLNNGAGNPNNNPQLNRDTKVKDLKELASNFIAATSPDSNTELLHPSTQPILDNNIVPFNMSIKEGFKGWFPTKEELYTSFLNEVESLSSLITNFPLASVFIDENDLDNLGYKLTTVSTLSDIPDAPAGGLAFNENTGAYEYILYTVDSSTEYVYQTITSNETDTSGGTPRVDFLLDKDNNKIFERKLVLTANPNEIYKSLLKAQSDLATGISLTIAAGTLAGGGSAVAALAGAFLSQSNNAADALEAVINQIKRYEKWTNESIFPGIERGGTELSAKYFFTNDKLGEPPLSFQDFEWDKRVARVLVPVDFGYKRTKKKKSTFGSPFTQYVYEDLGVRWVYVNLIDTSAFTSYRKNQAPSGQKNFINTPIQKWSLTNTSSSVTGEVTLSSSLDLQKLNMKVGDSNIIAQVENVLPRELNGYWQITIKDETTLEIIMDSNTPTSAIEVDGAFGDLISLITSFEETQPDDNNTPVTINYNFPYLPVDDALRNLAFHEYGPFDQSEFAVRTRSGAVPVQEADGTITYKTGDKEPESPDNYIPPGWEIFHESSKEVSAMRDGIDVYNTVNFLLRILISEFGETRVRLVETTRSLQDQNNLQLGGASSNFLSWHNYGLAARIIVTQGDGNDRIEEDSEDFWKLFYIAESFTAGAINGDYGEPFTVVWCARLAAGSDIFDWEFLPIGVGHKDAWKFRDAAYRQQDAYYANAFVNVDRNIAGNSPVTVLGPNEPPPLTGAYIFSNSKAYKNGVMINGETYADPNLIPRYQIPSNLILKDLQEFLFLIQNRQDSNGTDIGGKRSPDEWKSKNPRSFEQLVTYYSMIGNFSSARTLISGDYVRKFEQLVLSVSNQDPVAFVKAYLGDVEYQNVRIRPDNSGDNSFISLSTGLYTTPLLQMRSNQPEGSGNTFGQEQVDFDSVEFGQYKDGVFIAEDSTDISVIATDEPVISGYDIDESNNVTIDGGDAFILHSLVADQIVESFDVVKKNWTNIDFKVMHDRITESPNSRTISVLENEFGTIMSQDLLSFTQLHDMYQRMNINSKKRYVDSGVLGVGVDLENQGDRNEDQSVFEKLVSNAQLSGIKKVNISNESLIEEEPLRQIDIEKVIQEVNRRNVPSVRDIL